jgi:EAL domain-containing protein (putative c-di-GMP-specific phosphodiesterase class I)
VKTHAQLEFLQARQCDVGQGFHFSHPVPAEDFARLLVAENGAG